MIREHSLLTQPNYAWRPCARRHTLHAAHGEHGLLPELGVCFGKEQSDATPLSELTECTVSPQPRAGLTQGEDVGALMVLHVSDLDLRVIVPVVLFL